VNRYAQRIADNRQRHASIRTRPDPRVELAVRLPGRRTPPGTTSAWTSNGGAEGTAAQATAATANIQPIAATASAHDPIDHDSGIADQLQRLAARPARHRMTGLGDPPEAPGRAHPTGAAERISVERRDREIRRLDALRPQEGASRPAIPTSLDTVTPQQVPAPTSPTSRPTRHGSPTIAP
jgi:hypothetical protein